MTAGHFDHGLARSGAWNSAVALCWIQGVYFFLLGVWPLITIDSFQAVTGEKTDHLVTGRDADHWLVNTVGAVVAAIGIVFLFAAWRRRLPIEVAVLGITSALALAAIDVIYVLRNVIAPIYLVDAVFEILFVVGWIAWLALRERRDNQ